ncbi:MAG: LysM peptidoglycan-binding domain-containing protein [Treponemataceae bacterium]
MKKIILITAVLIFTFGICFANSYTNNEFQRKARMYAAQAQEAFDEGDYDKAVELTALSEENADKSRAYIEMMVAKADAQKKLNNAKYLQAWALKVRGDVNFPMAYSAGSKSLENAVVSFEKESFKVAAASAQDAIDSFHSIKEITPLPQFYIVRPWVESKDCYWNIAGRSYVYNNPTLWENLYRANKTKMPDPANPDLIHPGMKVEIPSISGEYREGTYSPKAEYNSFSTNR